MCQYGKQSNPPPKKHFETERSVLISTFLSFAMDIWLKLMFLFIIEHPVNCEVKTWIKDQQQPWGSANSPQIDCKKAKAIFKKELNGFLYMDSKRQLEEVILPTDGAVVMSSNSQVEFTNASNCQQSTNNVQLLDTSKRLWFSAKSWSTDGESENVAKPHIFQIPCECDIVEFPSENVYAVDLQYVDEIVADKILINDRIDNFEQFLETPIGQKMFLNSEAVHFSPGICHPPKYCGCHNPNRFRKYTEILCEEESKYCSEPHCLRPIQPRGHCCPICGAILNFRMVEDTCSFNITKMNEVGRKLKRFRNGKYVNKLQYYAGMVPGVSDQENFVQLVIAEVEDYTGISVEFMDYLTKDEHFKVDSYRHKVTSGDPYIRGQSDALLIMFLSLLFVLVIYAVIYVHYEKQPKYDNWVPISRLNMLRRSVAFARFENRQHEDDNDTIDVGLRYDDNEHSDEKSLNGFNNPMYEREHDREPVTLGTVETEMLEPTTSGACDADTLNAAGDIKLVDINLDANDK